MHGYPVFVQYSMAPPGCGWAPPPSLEPVRSSSTAPLSTGVKKYVVWCLISGGCSCLLGTMFLGVYFLLRSYTSTVGYFETVPTFVPATLLILTGLCIITLARRRNRYSFLIKLAGVCGLASSLVCALVTVTTTVLHMSRLQALSECEYSTKAKTCTCYSAPPERPLESDRESVTFVFDSTSDCGLVHGALYSCLRAIFGLSVAGVLVAVFSCMLVYQLLTHERKKMYWEQLELRCRSLYESQHLPTTIPSSQLNGPSIIGGPPLTTINGCRCCEQCHAHRQSTNLTGPAASAWESANRFWAAAALTSGGGQSIQTTAGNFYSPNPGSDELNITNNMLSGSNTNNTTNNGNQNNNQNNTSDNINNSNNQSNRSTGWSWPKMPWQKNNNNTNTSNSNNTSTSGNVNHNTRLFRQSPSSPDSQYGFSQNPTTVTGVGGIITTSDGTNIMMTTNGIPNQQTSYSIIGGLPYGVWGPPPPYSDPNSPARRPGNGINSINPTGLLNSSGRYQYIHQNQCPSMLEHQMHQQATQQSITNLECHQQNNSSSADGNSVMEHFNTSTQQNRNLIKRQTGLKSKDNYENTLSDSDGSRDRFSNSLPVRKMKKRIESLTKNNINASNNNCKNQSRNNQNVFQPINSSDLEEPEYHEPRNPDEELNSSPTNISSSSSAGATTNQINSMQQQKCSKRIKTGIDNTAFQGPDNAENNTVHHIEPSTESEVYFADVSSCCNVSVKNDSYYEDANQRPCQEQDIPDSKEDTEDYLAQRFGKRENSIRSRLPFPQNTVNSKVSSHSETFDKNQLNLPIINTRQNQIPKDISRQSMCSVDSGEKTDFTDLSPATPCTNNSYLTQQDHVNNFNLTNNNNSTADLKTINDSFIASYPFSSNEQCQEAHRRSTKNLQDMFLAPDAQYEIIKETNQFESTPLTLAFDEEINNSSNTNNFNNQNNNISNNNINSNNNSNNNINNSSSNNNIKNNKTTSHQIKSPKNLGLTPLNRSNIGANITSIIQNLGSSEAGLLYPDNRISNNSSVTRDNFSDQENHEGKILKIQGHNILNHKKQQSSQQPIPLSNSDNEWSDSSDRRL